MDCEQALEAVSAALDGELSQSAWVELEAHLSVCPQCRALAEDLRALSATLEEAEAVPPPGLSARVMERIAAEDKVVPLPAAHRRSGWRRWAGLAAMAALVVCVGGLGLWLGNGGASTGNASSPAASSYSGIGAAPSGSEDMTVLDTVPEESDMAKMAPFAADGAANSEGQDCAPDSAQPAPEPAPGATPEDPCDSPLSPEANYAGMPSAAVGATEPEEPRNCFFQNQQNVRITWDAAADAPSARILGSVDSLAEFAAQFPENDLTQLMETYDAEYFAENRLLAVMVEEGSGSISHSIAPQGLYRDEVEIVRDVPEVGTCDMAAWIIFAEVDAMFEDGDVLNVVFGD